MKRLTTAAALAGVISALMMSSALAGAQAPGRDVSSVVRGNTDFALDLYGQLRQEKGNIFFSPYSISAALAMTWTGARGNTEKQMKKVLGFPAGNRGSVAAAFAALEKGLVADPRDAGYELRVANALWAQKGYRFLRSFVDLNRRCFGAGLRVVDFSGHTEAARKTINAWVEDKTNRKIKDLIRRGDLDQLTRLVLTNAIYFKGQWATRFKKKRTRLAPFSLGGPRLRIQTVRVPMMSQSAEFGYAERKDLQVLAMPYKGGRLSMVALLPRGDLSALDKALTPATLKTWLAGLRTQEVNVYLPRFRITWGATDLVRPLKALGMRDAFTMGADFSGMDGTRKLLISKVLHKAFVDVNEEGTEAAAATAVVMRLKSAMRPLVFRADHPFLFLIRDNKTGCILFMGRVVDPR